MAYDLSTGFPETSQVRTNRTGALARPIEVPTLLVGAGIYVGWIALTLSWRALPLPVLMALGGVLVAWQGSLQHEAIHGHPTRNRLFNTLFAGVPLSLWLPYEVYRTTHLGHHRTRNLTDPLDDPESYYLAPSDWARMGRVRRVARHALSTLVGRVVLGPLVTIAHFIASEARLLAAGDRARWTAWAKHAVACALVLGWVVGVCHMPVWLYLAAVVYPATALTLVRSFAEHRPAANVAERSAVIEAGPFWSLLFLHNNLHAVHHAAPSVPWYQLPARYEATRARVLADNGGLVFRGYSDVARRFGLRAKDSPVHPG